MAEVTTTYQGKSVKDVPAEAFIKAFSAYLKSTGKVSCAVDWEDDEFGDAAYSGRNRLLHEAAFA